MSQNKSENPQEGGLDVSHGWGSPLPDYLEGTYTGWGRWEHYEVGTYRKRPCMVITKLNYKIGPCWPNAGKFVAYDNSVQVPEGEVEAVCYAEIAEDSHNDSSSATPGEKHG